MSNKITTSQEPNQKSLFQDLMNRRVPHIIGFYLAAGWAVLQFIDWMVNRYILSPHLVDFTLTSLVSFIPSILILAYFHGGYACQYITTNLLSFFKILQK